MSHVKVNSEHGARGPAPKTFERWTAQANKRGAKRFKLMFADGTTKLVAHKSAPDSAKRIEAMRPVRVEALDEKDAELGAWTFPEEEPEPEEPGYTKAEDDTEPERLLKTFAHLLADAHRQANRQLVETVSIQSRNFAEERKNLLSLQLASERLLAKRMRGGFSRVRVAEDGEGEGEEGEEQDNWLQEMLSPLLQRMVARHVADGTNGATATNGVANGEGGKEGKES